MSASNSASTPSGNEPMHSALAPLVKSLSAPAAAALLEQHPATVIAAVLGELNAAFVQDILAALPRGLVDGVMDAVPAETASAFTARSLGVQAVLWLTLGAATGWFWSRPWPNVLGLR